MVMWERGGSRVLTYLGGSLFGRGIFFSDYVLVFNVHTVKMVGRTERCIMVRESKSHRLVDVSSTGSVAL